MFVTLWFRPWSGFRHVHKIAKSGFIFIMAGLMSIHIEQLYSHWMDFYGILFLSILKICWENSSVIKLWQE